MVKSALADAAFGPFAQPAAKARILVVDDDEVFATTAGRGLTEAGYDVHVAGSFQIALAVLDGPKVDLLLTDLVMPNQVNGIALSRMARMRQRDVKVIFVSGYDIPEGADERSFGRILRKPVTNEQLIAEVGQALAAA